MTRTGTCMAIALGLVLPSAALAQCWQPVVVAPVVSVPSYYYAVPVVYAQPVPVYSCNPVPTPVVPPASVSGPAPARVPAVGTFATPTPAPPSGTRETPSDTQKPPKPPTSDGNSPGTESRYYDTYSVVPREPVTRKQDECSVGFWNLSGRDLVLKVNGQDRVLPRGKNLVLDLNRQFDWQLEGRAYQTAEVPSNESALEIVIRR
jgi:hypothetical protein